MERRISGAALYYHVPLSPFNEATPDCALWIVNPYPGLLNTFPHPDVILSSKSDLYDDEGLIPPFAITNHYSLTHTFTAFKVWEK